MMTSSKSIGVEPRLILGKIYLIAFQRDFSILFSDYGNKLFWRMKNDLGFYHTQNNCTKMMNQVGKNTKLEKVRFSTVGATLPPFPHL